MKKSLLLIAALVFVHYQGYSQESFRKSYKLEPYFLMKGTDKTSVHADSTIKAAELYEPIKDVNPNIREPFLTRNGQVTLVSGSATKDNNKIVISKGAIIEVQQVIFVKTEKKLSFTSLTDADKEKAEIEAKFKLGSTVSIPTDEILPAGKATVTREVKVDQAFLNALKIKREAYNDSLGKKIADKDGFVKFEEDKLWVNPNLDGDYTNQGMFYYSLSNRQTVKLYFTEWSVSALTIPLKYRPQSAPSKGIPHELTSDVNLNAFIGYTYSGLTAFHHREKVGNVENTRRWTIGGVFGASSLSLDKNNTSATDKKITDDVTLTKGMATLGLGLAYSYNKINFGAFAGVDYTLGDAIAKWNYNGRPWLGVAVGYSLISFK